MVSILFYLLLFFNFFNYGDCWKILVFNPRLSHSHVQYVGKIADILQEAGNDVTVLQQIQARNVSTIGSKIAKVILIDGVDVEEEMKIMKNDFDKSIWSTNQNSIFSANKILQQVWSMGEKQCKSLIKNTELLEKLTNEKFDIGFAEKFSSCAFGIFNKINISTIISGASTGFGESLFEDFGLTYPTSYLPPIMGGENIPKGFRGRLRNLITYHVSKYMYVDASVKSSQKAFDKIYGSEAPNIHKLSKDVAFTIVNTSPLLDFPHPTIPKVIEVAGIEYKNPGKLDNEWDKILNKRTKNVLLSFGSAVMSNQMPDEIKKTIVETFKSLPDITFIWKYESSNISFADTASNIIFKQWIPQVDLLNDERLNLFITHGGLNSAIELAYTGTPAIFIPLFSDQRRNAHMLARYGSSKIFNKENLLDSKKLSQFIQEMLYDNIYTEKAKKLSLMISNYPLDGKSNLIKSFQFAGSFGNIKEMDLPSLDMSFIELYNIDIYIFSVKYLYCICWDMSSIKHELVLSALKVIRPTRCLKSLVVSAICLGEGRTIESIYIEELTKQYGKEIAKNSEIEYTRDVNSLFNKRHSDKDLIILCDIITTNYSIERNFNCELLLEATVNCLKENGFIIIKENLRQHEGPLLTKINKLLQESYLIKFHEMNQLRYSIYMEGNFLDIYWILSREDKAFTDKKIFQFFNFIEEYSLVKADVKAFSGKEFFHFIDYNEKEHWNLLDRFESLRNGALMLQLGFTYLHLQTVVRYNNILFLMSPYTETIIDNLLYNQRAKDNRIFYILANFHLCTYSSNYYDVLFVPNFLHYNANYEKFFNDAFCCLKNGGEILITTLVIGPGSQNQEFEGIVKFYRLFLKTESEILNLMEKNGFSGISSEKMTDMLSLKIKKILSNEPSTFTSKKATFLNTYIQSKNLEFVLFYGKK